MKNEIVDKFKAKISVYLSNVMMNTAFAFGNVRRLDINGKYIYLWQDAKGQVSYCFNILDNEYFITSATKLGNVLSQHFQYEVEVVNNEKESLKKMTAVTIGLNKAISDSQRHDNFLEYKQQFEPQNSVIRNINNSNQQIYAQMPVSYNQNLMQPMFNQEELHKGIIQLSTYNLKSHLNTIFIKINELPIVHKELFRPNIKLAFFIEKNMNCKNSYIPSEHEIKYPFPYNLQTSFILLFILFMAKNNLENAMKIFWWLSNVINFKNKLLFPLVLHGIDDVYLKLFSEEVVEPLLNSTYCEKFTDNSLNEKVLVEKLNEKVIYHFHNVTTPTILDSSSKDFISRLIYKDELKIGKKNVTTLANILITSTSKYIPLIAKDVPCVYVDVASNLDDLCKTYNLNQNNNYISKLITNDLDNFCTILTYIDMNKLNNENQLMGYDRNNCGILDGDVDVLDVFETIIKTKDIISFERLKMKNEKLYKKLVEDFDKNRVDRKNLLEYFTVSFGSGIYKNNNAIIKALKDLSNTAEPFENITTFNNNGRVYYRI